MRRKDDIPNKAPKGKRLNECKCATCDQAQTLASMGSRDIRFPYAQDDGVNIIRLRQATDDTWGWTWRTSGLTGLCNPCQAVDSARETIKAVVFRESNR
jgi:hypothetical protein